jgi:HlyD family secretion protein
VTTYPVTLRIQKQDGLVAGMSASADILVAQKENALVIPISALKVDGDRTYVTRITLPEGEAQQDNQMNRALAASRGTTQDVEVKIGIVNSAHAEILEGLSEGDIVQTVSSDSDMLSFMMGGPGGGGMQGGSQGSSND